MKQVPTSSKRKRGESDAQSIERLRREKATEYYTMLQALVPTLFPKATRSKIVDETISYIEKLEGMVEFLKQQKKVRVTEQNSTSSVEVTVSGNTTFFGMCFLSQPKLLSKVLQVFVLHLADVLTATVTSHSLSHSGITVTRITATAYVLEPATSERIKMDLMKI